jgi:hypothetical protein
MALRFLVMSRAVEATAPPVAMMVPTRLLFLDVPNLVAPRPGMGPDSMMLLLLLLLLLLWSSVYYVVYFRSLRA